MSRRRALMVVALLALPPAACVTHDFAVPPQRQVSTFVAGGAIRAYRRYLSPHAGKVVQCRFRPTCSEYGLAAVQKYGGLKGTAKALWRIARCNPLTPAGTVDEV